MTWEWVVLLSVGMVCFVGTLWAFVLLGPSVEGREGMKIYFGYHDGQTENAYREINSSRSPITRERAEEVFKEFMDIVYGGKKTTTNITSCAERESIKD